MTVTLRILRLLYKSKVGLELAEISALLNDEAFPVQRRSNVFVNSMLAYMRTKGYVKREGNVNFFQYRISEDGIRYLAKRDLETLMLVSVAAKEEREEGVQSLTPPQKF